MSDNADLRDELPADLNAAEFVGAYQFPDNSRRRRPAMIYAALAALLLVIALAHRGSPDVLVNEGYLWAAALLGAVAMFSFTSGWRMAVDEQQALVLAQHAVGFPVGHASAQQVWRGLRSRPTWRVLVYSAESPPRQRGLVLVDAVDSSIVEQFVEANPETDWVD